MRGRAIETALRKAGSDSELAELLASKQRALESESAGCLDATKPLHVGTRATSDDLSRSFAELTVSIFPR